MKETPIPEYPGYIIHIDIYSTEKHLVLTAIDKFSKLAQGRIIKSKAIEDIRQPLHEILFYYGVPKFVIVDNEKPLNSASISFMMKDQLNIEVFKVPPYKSSVNGQIERLHSTLSEIMKCLKREGKDRNFADLLQRAIYEYNNSIHSVTKQRPLDTFFGRKITTDREQFEQACKDNITKLKEQQTKDLKYHNQSRTLY